jgi:hypothetical protein
LEDVAQDADSLQAGFDITLTDLHLWLLGEGVCLANLQCPTNLVSQLIPRHAYGIAFEVEGQRHTWSFGPQGEGDSQHTEAASVIMIHGRLIAVIPE